MPKMRYSIVEYRGERSNRHCGYCNGSFKFSHGMWAHNLNVEDYQALIDRGWRRSGKYCYKPTMNQTCCPPYTIRCNAMHLKMTKSKKKTAKKMLKFLLSGDLSDFDHLKEHSACKGGDDVKNTTNSHAGEIADLNKETNPKCLTIREKGSFQESNSEQVEDSVIVPSTVQSSTKLPPKKGSGPDPMKPRCKKAKQMRLERKMSKLDDAQKMAIKGSEKVPCSKQNEAKTLQDFLPHLQTLPNAKHKLEVRLVNSGARDDEFQRTKAASLQLYQKYQMTIHKDAVSDCSEKQWTRFLVDTPLNMDPAGPGKGYGSFHNQYWLDDRLIAVGVVDVLPGCVSSVYLYYDPDYNFLSLGAYSAMSEISLVRDINNKYPSLKYYYMGYYIHSCPKMNYKGGWQPSDLLCPETYMWVPISKCLATLSKQKYARLNVLDGGSQDALDEEGRMSTLDAVKCLYHRSVIDYGSYKFDKYVTCRDSITGLDAIRREEDKTVEEYVSFVGRTCAQRMLIYRSSQD